MKILIYAHAFAPMIGGVETYTMLLARGLVANSPADVIVVTQARANGMADLALPFRVVRRPGFVRLVRLVREANVIHIANPALLPMLLAWLLRKPTAVQHDGYQSACPNGMFFYQPTQSDCTGHFLARRYQKCIRCNSGSLGIWGSLRILLLTFPRRWLNSRMALNIGPTKHVGNRVRLPRTEIIYHGVPFPPEDDSAANSGARAIIDQARSSVCFAYVGRMVQEKGVPVLLRAAHLLARQGYEFRLKLIGDGPVRAELESLTDELGLRERTVFTGPLRGEALHDALKEATAAVMPSIWEDVAPLTSIEHMMNGRPLVASDIGGLGELVDGVGLKFSAGDSEGLADCLRRVLENPALVDQLGKSASARARILFTMDRTIKDHLRAYLQIAGSELTPKRAPGTDQVSGN